MTPKMTDEISMLAAKKPLQPEEAELLKKVIIKHSEVYLNLKEGGNSSINLTDVIRNDIIVVDANDNFIRDIGRRMERTRNYSMYETKKDDGSYNVTIIPLDRPWWERYSPALSIGSLILGIILTVFGDVVKSHLEK
ncbi:MAG: hypothetical protein ABIN89_00015 [Chitinophagaceae bacterium]